MDFKFKNLFLKFWNEEKKLYDTKILGYWAATYAEQRYK